MPMLKYIFLGIVQGITEFLPVSSSGHLVIFQHLFKIDKGVVFLDTVLHLGTLCSLIIFFRRDIFVLICNFFSSIFNIIFRGRLFSIWRNDVKFKLCIYIGITTLITGVIVMLGKNFFERQFESIDILIFTYPIIGVILFFTKNLYYGKKDLQHISLKDSILLGIVQSFAIFPGISRSGITISFLFLRNLDKESAFKLSFLISMPIILSAFVLKFKEAKELGVQIPNLYLTAGFLSSFVFGLVTLYILRLILKREGFYKFSYYCFFLSAVVLLLRIIY